MPEGPDGRAIIIVKKVSGHGGHHGGSWKVAYADFVTSMMCLFLVLWLVNTASVATREKIASYFKRPGIFEEGSGAPVQLGGAGFLPAEHYVPPEEQENKKNAVRAGLLNRQTGGVSDNDRLSGAHPPQEQEVLRELAEAIESKLVKGASGSNDELSADGTNEGQRQYLPKVAIRVDEYGLHLEIMDTPQASMFALGSSRILPAAEGRLKLIASTLKNIPNMMDIEGHTDGLPFKGSAEAFDNWDLSTSRANAARRVLIDSGVAKNRIIRIAGLADTKLKVPTKPADPSNRRITIKVRFSDDAAKALEDLVSEDKRDDGPGSSSSTNGNGVGSESNGARTSAKGSEDKAAQDNNQRGLKVQMLTEDENSANRSGKNNRPAKKTVVEEKYLIFGRGYSLFD